MCPDCGYGCISQQTSAILPTRPHEVFLLFQTRHCFLRSAATVIPLPHLNFQFPLSSSGGISLVIHKWLLPHQYKSGRLAFRAWQYVLPQIQVHALTLSETATAHNSHDSFQAYSPLPPPRGKAYCRYHQWFHFQINEPRTQSSR